MSEQENDESKVNATADAAVALLINAAAWSKRMIAALVTVCVVLAGVVGYLVYRDVTHPFSKQLAAQLVQQRDATAALEQYVKTYAQHSCNALELLTATPVPNPGPSAADNPSREFDYKFYEAVLSWEQQDGCPAVSVKP